MFGYIGPDTPYLFIKDETLYKALYCGVCRGISKECGLMARTALSYDIAFMSALMHNICGQDVEIERRRCPVHPIKRRNMAAVDDITRMLACVNTALAYHKLCDDKRDGDARGVLRFLYSRGYKKVLKKCPRIAEIISEQMEQQTTLERDGCAIIDMACEPTAQMMKGLSQQVLGERATENTSALAYAIGKWIYLIDALDDYDKDVKKGRYNVLFNAYGAPDKATAVSENQAELVFIFDSLFADMRLNLSAIKFNFNHDLTDNIILRGIPLKSRQIMFGAGCNGEQGK